MCQMLVSFQAPVLFVSPRFAIAHRLLVHKVAECYLRFRLLQCTISPFFPFIPFAFNVLRIPRDYSVWNTTAKNHAVVFLKSNTRSNEVSPSGILKYTRRSRVYFRMPWGDTSLLQVLLFKIFIEWWMPCWFSCPPRDGYHTMLSHDAFLECSILEL